MTYWPNDIARHTGDTIPVQPWAAEASTEVGQDDDDIGAARGVVHAIVITVVCALLALSLAAIWSIA